jgi:hypothetical protein
MKMDHTRYLSARLPYIIIGINFGLAIRHLIGGVQLIEQGLRLL